MNLNKKLFEQLELLTTEKVNKASKNIDALSTFDILKIINNEDAKVSTAVKSELKHLAKAVDLIVKAIKSGGRLFYVGAGTSGRLAVIDAAEMPPTFGTDPKLVQAIIAGGNKTVFRSQEGVEDREVESIKNLRKLRLNSSDVVCGIAASLRTPFVSAALAYAKQIGCKTILVTTNARSVLLNKSFDTIQNSIDVAICPDVGPEIIAGSTRMKSGTAQKMVLNMLTTASMIRLGKVYGNLMVDLKLNSRKLEERAKRVIMNITEVDYERAEEALKKSGGHVKTAIVMILKNTNKAEAQKKLKNVNGFLRPALK
ncbi:MAG: N-acetylmuramic acid 6-phosphate etherase [Bacteroidota bacterium]|nr:N-acetylmuramic acid 6-phosphate etherase [Bacteroidota bacterium]